MESLILGIPVNWGRRRSCCETGERGLPGFNENGKGCRVQGHLASPHRHGPGNHTSTAGHLLSPALNLEVSWESLSHLL